MNRVRRGVALAALLFALVQVGALALVPTFHAAGYQAVENPQDPTNSALYVGVILVVTALMLGAFRLGLDRVVRAVVVLTSGLLSWYVFGALLPRAVAIAAAAGVAIALLAYPEWYVVDAAGVVIGAGAAALFGISFGLLPALLLLVVLAAYDAVSVYRTEHMLDLAEGVMDLRLPVVLVVPLSWSYSLLEAEFGDGPTEQSPDDTPDGDGSAELDGGRSGVAAASDEAGDGTDGEGDRGGTPEDSGGENRTGGGPSLADREAFFVGLGDAVMPTVLVASAAFFSPAASLGLPLLPALNLPALFAMVGTFAGLGLLLRMVLRGEAHAGLPLLNGGTIAGYLVGSLLAGVRLVAALGLKGYL